MVLHPISRERRTADLRVFRLHCSGRLQQRIKQRTPHATRSEAKQNGRPCSFDSPSGLDAPALQPKRASAARPRPSCALALRSNLCIASCMKAGGPRSKSLIHRPNPTQHDVDMHPMIIRTHPVRLRQCHYRGVHAQALRSLDCADLLRS